MARRTKPPEIRQARLTDQEMRAAIPRLQARIKELREIDVNSIIERGDPALSAVQGKVRATLSDILGADTVEYHQMGLIQLDEAPLVLGHRQPVGVIRQGYAGGIERTVGKLQTLIELFDEKLGGIPEDPSTRARRAFGDLDLHPEVARAAGPLFENGHYANAVEDACKVLDALVKMRSGREDLSGTELMQAVFSPKSPTLRFSDLQTDSERSEQQGMMFLYAGTMLALRNPRAHGLIDDDPERAVEYLSLVSLLAKALDRTKRSSPSPRP